MCNCCSTHRAGRLSKTHLFPPCHFKKPLICHQPIQSCRPARRPIRPSAHCVLVQSRPSRLTAVIIIKRMPHLCKVARIYDLRARSWLWGHLSAGSRIGLKVARRLALTLELQHKVWNKTGESWGEEILRLKLTQIITSGSSWSCSRGHSQSGSDQSWPFMWDPSGH